MERGEVGPMQVDILLVSASLALFGDAWMSRRRDIVSISLFVSNMYSSSNSNIRRGKEGGEKK